MDCAKCAKVVDFALPMTAFAVGNGWHILVCAVLYYPAMMTLRQLRYFVEIARCGSFSQAAMRLNIAQPALSQNVSALESLLGIKLFERHAKGISLTFEGVNIYQRTVKILDDCDRLGSSADADLLSGRVNLCIAGSLASVVVAPLITEVTKRYPLIELRVTDGLSSEVRGQVEAGNLHLAMMPGAVDLQGIEQQPLLEEHFMLFGAYVQMADMPDDVRFTDIAKLPLATTDRAHDLRKVIERAAQTNDLSLNIRFELNSPAMLIAIVKAGLAYAILPQSSCVEAVAAKSVAGRRITGADVYRVQSIVWPSDRPLIRSTAAVRDVIVSVMQTLVSQSQLHGRLLSASHKKS
jgi:LysR family transcriptional regulator, nitrogen assimilation regulatory protein